VGLKKICVEQKAETERAGANDSVVPGCGIASGTPSTLALAGFGGRTVVSLPEAALGETENHKTIVISSYV
jgi:hypothetical protein